MCTCCGRCLCSLIRQHVGREGRGRKRLSATDELKPGAAQNLSLPASRPLLWSRHLEQFHRFPEAHLSEFLLCALRRWLLQSWPRYSHGCHKGPKDMAQAGPMVTFPKPWMAPGGPGEGCTHGWIRAQSGTSIFLSTYLSTEWYPQFHYFPRGLNKPTEEPEKVFLFPLLP